MPIEGPIRELPLPELLQLLDRSGKTGRLRVETGGGVRVELHLIGGRLVGASAPALCRRLGELLLLDGKITTAELERALREQRRSNGVRLGEVLVASGAVSETDVRDRLRFQLQEIVLRLLEWTEGHFTFNEVAPPDPGSLRLALSVEPLLFEAAKRADELAAVRDRFRDGSVPRLSAPAEGSGALSLAVADWEVLTEVDGSRGPEVIARRLGRSEPDVVRTLLRLLDLGLVEIEPHPGAEDAARPALADGGQRSDAHSPAPWAPEDSALTAGLRDSAADAWPGAGLARGAVAAAAPAVEAAALHRVRDAIDGLELERTEAVVRRALAAIGESAAPGSGASRGPLERALRALAALRDAREELDS